MLHLCKSYDTAMSRTAKCPETLSQAMTRCLLGISAALALGACTAQLSPTDPASNESVNAERDAATQVYLACLMRAAKRLDDHKSDVEIIAHRMMAACGEEFDRQMKAYSSTTASEDEQKFADRAQKTSLWAAMQMILQNRKAARKEKQPG